MNNTSATSATGKIKCISFSIFGNDNKYLIGALKNITLAEKLLPDYICYFFYDNSVPSHLIDEIKQASNTKLFDMSGSNIPGTMWRFLAIDFPEVALMLSRDTDSRLSNRECSIVREWEEKATKFMIIKDHPGSHGTFAMLAGLWAMKKKSNLNIAQLINDWLVTKTPSEINHRNADQNFLDEQLKNHTLNDLSYYDDYNINQVDYCQKIAYPRENWHFIGEIFDEKNKRDYHWKALRAHHWRSKGFLGYCFAKVANLFVPEWRP